ncbi:hypothetical protein GC173_04035 [bacterium]|nr:hypothetical protein [bacterium]
MAAPAQKLLTVRLEEDFHQKVRMATIAHETTMAEVVRAALEAWLKTNGAKPKKAAPAAKPAKVVKVAKAPKASKPAKAGKSAKKDGGKKKKK